jgi:hypothetical protein
MFLIAGLMSNVASANCLAGREKGGSINSRVRGVYVNATTANTQHYVILDKATCVADSGVDVVLGSGTKTHLYLRFKDTDKALLSTLLAAQAQGTVVAFRMAPTSSAPAGDINDVAYVVSPASANSQ